MDLQEFTPEIIESLFPGIYNNIIYDNIIKNCLTIDDLIKFNLCHIMDKTYRFCYSNNFLLTDLEIYKLFEINKKGIITLSLFIEQPNKYNVYQKNNTNCRCINDIHPITRYAKKYLSFYIPKSFLTIIHTIFDKLKKQYNNLHILYQTDNNFDNYNIPLTFDENFIPLITTQYLIHTINQTPDHFTNNLKYKLKNEYIGIIIYEDNINTTTDLITPLFEFSVSN
jgi:hypothetical protein